MANHRRRRPRAASYGRKRQSYKVRHTPEWNRYGWRRNWPRWHDVVFHTRPRRRRTRACVVLVMQGTDPDLILWPIEKKPHVYYW